MNGSLTPFAHTNGLYFNEEPEPQNCEFEIFEDLGKESEKQGYLTIDIGEGDPLKYYDAKYKMMKMATEDFKAKRVSDSDVLELEFEGEDEGYKLL